MKEAIVLAGGLGTRISSVSGDLPKAMIPVGDRPFLCHVLDYLCDFRIDTFILSVGHRRDSIIGYFGDRYYDREILYAVEQEPLGTGGGIRLAMEQVQGDNAFVLNGDTLFEVDLNRMLEFHEEKNARVTLALRKLDDVSRFGTVTLDPDGLITGFKEKSPATGPGWINGGIYLIEKNYLLEKQADFTFSIEKDFFEKVVTDRTLFGFKADGYFIDIGIPEDYERARQELG